MTAHSNMLQSASNAYACVNALLLPKANGACGFSCSPIAEITLSMRKKQFIAWMQDTSSLRGESIRNQPSAMPALM